MPTPATVVAPVTAIEVLPIVLRGASSKNLTEDEFHAFCQDNPTLRIEREADQTITIVAPCWTEAGFQSGEAF